MQFALPGLDLQQEVLRDDVFNGLHNQRRENMQLHLLLNDLTLRYVRYALGYSIGVNVFYAQILWNILGVNTHVAAVYSFIQNRYLSRMPCWTNSSLENRLTVSWYIVFDLAVKVTSV